MTFTSVPWLELAVGVPLVGGACLARVRDPYMAFRGCLALASISLVCAVAASGGYAWGLTTDGTSTNDLLYKLVGRKVFTVDALSATLVPILALIHLLTAISTSRTKMSRFSFSWLLICQAIRMATFACDGWDLGILLVVGVLPPYLELRWRGRPTGVYVFHMLLFVALLLSGLAAGGEIAVVLLMGAVLVRNGTVPVHVWVTDLFENGSFGGALLYSTPITAMYAALRLVLPLQPSDWILVAIGSASLVTAVYAAGMAIVQTDARRFFAFLFLSHASLVLVGLELHTAISLTGALALWGSVMLSMTGFGLTLRALEGRFGRLSLAEFRGLYASSPALAVSFLLTGLASVGFPGMSGFVAAELLVDGAMGANPFVGLVVVVASALNGVAVMRAYFYLFTGVRYTSGVELGITAGERVAVLTLTALILAGGFYPQAYITSRHHAAQAALGSRNEVTPAVEH